MRKSMSLFMVLSIATGLFGADTSSPSQSYSDGRYKVETEFEVASDIVKIGLSHLPSNVQCYVNAIANGHIKSGVVLFEGPPGAAKTTTAKCIGQQYYNNTPAFPGELRSHVFHGSMLTGDQYQNSGVTVLRTNIEPIIARAKDVPQLIVFDEFQKLVKKSENNSSERESAGSQILKLFDAMDKTNNIIFIGTCNKTKGIPGPIMSRFSDLFRFGQPSAALSAAVLEHYLLKADIPTTVTTAAQLGKVAKNFKEGVRQVKHIVNRAKICVLDREIKRGIIEHQDLIDAINEYNREFGPKKVTWEKFFKKHERKMTVLGVASGLILSGVGLWLYIKYRQEDIARQEANKAADIVRETMWRWGDVMRQIKFRQEDIVRQDVIRAKDINREAVHRYIDALRQNRIHQEQLAQGVATALSQMNQAAEQEAARLRREADYSGLVPRFTWTAFYQLSRDQQELCLQERQARIDQQYGAVGIVGDNFMDRLYSVETCKTICKEAVKAIIPMPHPVCSLVFETGTYGAQVLFNSIEK